MTKFLMAAVLVVFSSVAVAQTAPKVKPSVTYDATILRANDGDTVVVAAPFLPAPLKKELAVRIFGVDTPEKGFRAQCPAENEKGLAASKFTKDMIDAATKKQYTLMDWDKFGGRVLGDIILDGKSLRAELIKNGYAREYYGEAKQSWCK